MSGPELQVALRLAFGWRGWTLERDVSGSRRWQEVEAGITPKRARKIAALLGPTVLADVERTIQEHAEWSRAEAQRVAEAARESAARDAQRLFDAEARARQADEDARSLGLPR